MYRITEVCLELLRKLLEICSTLIPGLSNIFKLNSTQKQLLKIFLLIMSQCMCLSGFVYKSTVSSYAKRGFQIP